MIYLIIGPSGSGKSTIERFLADSGVERLVSCTSRPRLEGEINGKDYHFLREDDFDLIDKVCESNYLGHKYCLTKQEVEYSTNHHQDVFAVVHLEGAKNMIKQYRDSAIIYIDVTIKEMRDRMRQRGDSTEEIDKRIQNAVVINEFEGMKHADYIVRNENIDLAKNQILNIIRGEMKNESLG